jgi:hypothetical protein
MKIQLFIVLACLTSIAAASEGDQPEVLLAKEKGDAKLAKVVVDSAPGTVSAMSMLGIAVDQTTVVQNPRNLTVALKAFDGKNAFGLAFTPARTSLMPMDLSTYNDSAIGRIWGNTTFSFAQGRATISAKEFERRAISVESSFFLQPHQDDPAVMYWDALAVAAKHPEDTKNDCLIMRESKPVGPQQPAIPVPAPAQGAAIVTMAAGDSLDMAEDPEGVKSSDALAAKCRAKVTKRARWNASRMWLSWSSGHYRLADGGDTHSLGKTTVLGVTYGLGEVDAKTASAFTISGKRTSNSPVVKTMGDAAPTFASNSLAQFRWAYGSPTLRAVLEGSNVKKSEPTASERTYKRAIGFDFKVSDEIWLNIRGGRQRRIDNSGDENGSSFSVSYSPKALLSL